jgi:hypothetical protein
MNHLILLDNSDDTGMETAQAINNIPPLSLLPDVAGMEDLGVGERVGLFFKEFSTRVDRRMVGLNKSAHVVDLEALKRVVKEKNILFVKNVGVEIVTPEGYTVGFGNMMMHTQAVIGGIYIIGSLKTEASRLYDWLKEIVVKGRIDRSFQWSISDLDNSVKGAEGYLRLLKDNGRKVTFPLGKVYMNFEEMYGVINAFNNAAGTISSRDIEMITKEMSNVYELGQLLVKKIKANDIVLDKQGLEDIEFTINRFLRLTNIAGAMSVLFNELSSVLREQALKVRTIS